MSEWWAYRPRDFLMFSPEAYYRLLELYNADIWPWQIFALAAGLAIIGLLFRPTPWAGRAIAALLAAAWAFIALVYFFERYATINLAAPYFGWGFAAQSLLLVLSGAVGGRLTFSKARSPGAAVGLGLVVFATVVQPLIGPVLGRPWSGMESFAVAPDPTVLATLGVLLAAERIRWELLPIPLLWCVVTGGTLWIMGSPEALLMPAAGLIALVVAGYRGLSGPARRG